MQARQQIAQLQAQLIALQRATRGAGGGPQVNPKAYQAANRGTAAMAASSAMARRNVDDLGGAFGNAMTKGTKFGNQLQWTGRQLQYNFALPIALAGAYAVKSAMDQEQAMVRVRKVYGDTTHGAQFYRKELEALEENFTALSNRFAVHREEVIGIAGDWAAAGASGVALARATKLTLETMVLGELEAVDATKALIAIQAQYGMDTKQLTQVIADLNTIENETGTTMGDLIQAMSRSAAVARQAGVGHRELGALVAALVPAAGSAATAGNGLKTILTRLMAPTNDAADAMKEMGINVYDAGWQSMTATERLETMAKGFEDLTEGQRVFISDLVAGKWQIAKFSQLMATLANENGYYAKALEATTDPIKTMKVYQEELNTVLSSSPQKFKQTGIIIQNALADVMIPLLPYIVATAQKVAQMAQAFANMNPYAQGAILALAGFLLVFGPLIRYMGSSITLFTTLGNGLAVLGKKALIGLAPFRLLGRIVSSGWTSAAKATSTGAASVAGATKALGANLFRVLVASYAGLVVATQWVWYGVATATAAGATAIPILWRKMQAAILVASLSWGAAMKSLQFSLTLALLRAQMLYATMSAVGWGTYWARVLAIFKLGWAKVIATSAAGHAKMLAMGLIKRWPLALALMALLGTVYHFRDEIIKAFAQMSTWVVAATVPLADWFGKLISFIIKQFYKLPEGVQKAMLAVVTVVKTAAEAVYSWFSYLNPWARHSPSLVDSVRSGMDAVTKQYARAKGVGNIFAKAAADLARFKKAAASQGSDEWSDKRADVSKAMPGMTGGFNQQVGNLAGLKNVLAGQEAAVKRQEAVVKNWDKALENANDTLDRHQDKLDNLKDQLDAVQTAYDNHKEALEAYASAPIKGLGAMEDKIFDNEMAQKKLRLEIMKMEDATGTIDEVRNKLAMLQGDIETAQGDAIDLRHAGGGSDVTGPIEAEIDAMKAQYKATERSMKPLKEMHKELDKLGRTGERLDLEKSLEFDPQIRAIDKLVNAQKELTYDEIVAGVKKHRAAMDELQPRLDAANAAVQQQEIVIKAATAARDQISKSYDLEKEKLDTLNDSYRETENLIRDIEEALNSLGSAASQKIQLAKSTADAAAGAGTDPNKFAAAAAADFPDVGGMAGIGREGGIADQSFDINALTEELTRQTASMFGGLDFFKPIKDAWAVTWGWIKTNVGPVVADTKAALTAGWKSLFDGEGIEMSAVTDKIKTALAPVVGFFKTTWEAVKTVFRLVKPDLERIWEETVEFFQNIWTQIAPEIAKFGELWKPLKDATKQAWEWIVLIIKGAIALLLPIIKVGFSILGHVLGPIFDMIIGIIKGALMIIRGVFRTVLAFINGDWKEGLKGIGEILKGGFHIIYSIVKGFGGIVWGIFKGIVGGIFGFFKWLYDVLVGHSIVPDLVAKIISVFKGLGPIVKWINDNIISPVKTAFGAIWGGIRVALNTLIRGTYSVFDAVGKGIAGGINIGIDAINKLIDGLNWIGKNVPGLKFEVTKLTKVQFTSQKPPQFASGGMPPATAVGKGFKINQARAIVGEGNSNYPEYVIPTDPRYRTNAQRLLTDAMQHIPMYAGGGVLDFFKSGASAVGGAIKNKAQDVAAMVRKGTVMAAMALPLKGFDLTMKAMEDKPRPIKEMIMQKKNDIYNWMKGADKATADLAVTASQDGNGGSGSWNAGATGLHPKFLAMWNAFNASQGNRFRIGSGWRSSAAQARLYDRWVRRVPGQAPAARPGTSNHEFGLAIDHTPHSTAASRRAAAGYGLRYPMSYEPWHIEPANLSALKYSSSVGYDKRSLEYAAKGGILNKEAIAVAGEAGREVLSPLDPLWARFDRLEKMYSETIQGGRTGDVTINIYGDLSFPNIDNASDAEDFITNLEIMARS